MGMMLPAFEKQLFGLKAGDKFDFVLKCEDAYGEPSDEAVQELPREIFVDSEGKLDALVVEGATLPLHTPDGQIIRGSVLEIKDEVVVFDFNHPPGRRRPPLHRRYQGSPRCYARGDRAVLRRT